MKAGILDLEGTLRMKDRKTISREGKTKERKKKLGEVQEEEEEESLRKVTVKIGLERIDIQKEIMVEALLDSRVIGLVMSFEFVRKKGFKLKKIERLIYQRHREKMQINVIGG